MKQVLLAVQILISVSLVFTVLIQSSKGGLGNAFGGTGEFRSRRGAEQAIFRLTLILAALFLVVSVANLSIR